MYTRCPQCNTVFRVTTQQLNVARGEVRCGNCAGTFNAVETLMEQPPREAADFDSAGTETSPESVAESEELVTEDQPTNQAEQSLEFDVPEQNWAGFFVQAEPSPGFAPGHRENTEAVRSEYETGWEVDEAAPWTDEPPVQTDEEDEAEDIPPWLQATTHDKATTREVFEGRRWRIGIAVLLVILFSQLLHYNRDALAASVRYGAAIRATYEWFGAALYPEWDLDAFQIRGSEVVGGSTDALEIVANVEVVGAHQVGLPLVRVALRDRWSNPVAGRVFFPSEYLADDSGFTGQLVPGTIIPVKISVADPGVEAQGYELDICLPRRHLGLQCQSGQDPFRK